MKEKTHGHAVVLGGSIAGLLAARVLTGVYDQVTVVDRDELAPGVETRRGAPHARHIHALLTRGQQLLEELFPGLTAELVAHGAPIGDVLGDARLLFGGHRLARTETGLIALSASRPLLEDRVRARVRALPGMRFAPLTDVVGLRSSPDRRRVTGVRLLRRANGSAEEALAADLVVDATGRGSRAPAWLEALGFGRPEETRVRVDVGYATRRYRLPPDALDGDLACVHGATPDRPRGAALARLEGDVWMLTLFGVLGDYPPTDLDGIDAFARSLRFPDIHDALATAEPIDDPTPYRFPANVRRRYEQMRHLPDGFLVIGDALCCFNPIYGQGMTVAALQALALRNHLPSGSLAHSRPVFRALARVTDAPWELAIGADLALPGVEGPRTPRLRLAGAYVMRLQAAAADNPELARAFVRVTGLVDPPTALMRPAIALQVLRPRPDAGAGGRTGRRASRRSARGRRRRRSSASRRHAVTAVVVVRLGPAKESEDACALTTTGNQRPPRRVGAANAPRSSWLWKNVMSEGVTVPTETLTTEERRGVPSSRLGASADPYRAGATRSLRRPRSVAGGWRGRIR